MNSPGRATATTRSAVASDLVDTPAGIVRRAAHLAAANAIVTADAGYGSCHRLHGEFDWRTAAEESNGTA